MIDRISAFIFVLLMMQYVSAQPVDNLFPDSRTVYSSRAEHAEYRLALGPLQKNNNIWQAEREEKISGLLHRRAAFARARPAGRQPQRTAAHRRRRPQRSPQAGLRP